MLRKASGCSSRLIGNHWPGLIRSGRGRPRRAEDAAAAYAASSAAGIPGDSVSHPSQGQKLSCLLLSLVSSRACVATGNGGLFSSVAEAVGPTGGILALSVPAASSNRRPARTAAASISLAVGEEALDGADMSIYW